MCGEIIDRIRMRTDKVQSKWFFMAKMSSLISTHITLSDLQIRIDNVPFTSIKDNLAMVASPTQPEIMSR